MISIHQSEKYCADYTQIENYEKAINDDTQIWICHHKNGITLNCGPEKLIELGLYYNRPPGELIFVTLDEHNKLHKSGKTPWNKGIPHSEKTRNKQSESHKGLLAGSKHPMAKECNIDGKNYGCIKDAWKDICPEIPYTTFYKRYKNNKL